MPLWLLLAIFGLTLAAVYVLLAAGLALVFNVLRIPNFAHAALFVAGGYTAAECFDHFGLPAVAALPFAFIVTGLLGIAIWFVAFLPIKGRERTDMFVTSFGVFIILENVFLAWYGPQTRSYPVTGNDGVVTPGLSIDRVVVIGVSAVIMTILIVGLNFTLRGRALAAVSQNTVAAEAAGINTDTVSIATLFLGSGLGGVAGALLGGLVGVSPGSANDILLKIFAILIVGGMGSLLGPVLAAIPLALAESYVSFYASQYTELVFFVALLAILVVRPSGLFGRRELGTLTRE